MRIIFGSMLGIMLLCIFAYEYKKTKDLFSPLCVFSLFQFIRYVPNIILEEKEWSVTFNDSNIMKVIIIETLFVISVIIGYKSRIRKSDNRAIEKNIQTAEISLFQIYFIYFIGFAVKLKMIIAAGGLTYILSNTGKAYISLSSGNGYLNSIMYMVFVSFFMMMERIKRKERKRDVFALICMIVAYAATDLIFSHRSMTMTIIIIVIFGINYLFKRIRIRDMFKPKMMFAIIIAGIIMVIMPIYRSGQFSDNGSKSVTITLNESINSIIDRMSMVGRDAFTYEHFNMDNHWMGKSYLNIFLAPIPSAIWSEKPAVDDGMYLVHLIYGYDIEPNASVSSMKFKASIPFTPQGLLYANFGLFGVVFGGILTGRIYAYFYSKLLNKNNIYNVALYRTIIIEFALTTGIIVSVLMQIIYIKILYYFNKHKYRRIKKNEG